MRSCPETEKIRALRSGCLSEEEAGSLRRHAGQCPACRQELKLEDEIERELSRGFTAPEIEGEVIRELRVLNLMKGERQGRWFYKYLLFAGLTAVFGFLVMPRLLHLPAFRLGPFFSPERLAPVASFLESNPLVMIVIGNALMVLSTVLFHPRVRRTLRSL